MLTSESLKPLWNSSGETTDNFNIFIYENRRPLGKQRSFNAPETKEVGIKMPTEPVGQRDILLHLLEDSLNQIYELCPAYDTLQYTFLVSTGSHG